MEELTGVLPAKDQQVVIVGELTQLELGYELDVMEIRSGGEVLLRRGA
jgi:hypothetical protein